MPPCCCRHCNDRGPPLNASSASIIIKQFGTAFSLYTDANDNYFPAIASWNLEAGDLGTVATHAANQYGFEDRPLNEYLTTPKVAECPADAGDALYDYDNAFVAYGTSYIATWMWGPGSHYGIAHVTGRTDRNSYAAGAPMRTQQMTRTENKAINFEYSVYGNRPLSDHRAYWHNTVDRRYVTLWGDTHVSWYLYPISIESMPTALGNPDNDFW